MNLTSVYKVKDAEDILYAILSERTADESISHRSMPTKDEHREFMNSRPYLAWYLIGVDRKWVGSIYLTGKREIGLFILREFQGNGYGSDAIRTIAAKWPGRFLANINPRNEKSIRFFTKHGFRHIQNTYEL